jgi:hypothetical protein
MSDAARSRCTHVRKSPMAWHMTPVKNVDVTDEMRAAVDGRPALEREMRLAALVTTMKMAARGDLHPDSDDIGPIRLDPQVFELRWNFGRELYRLCHGEPPSQPDHLIGLRFHQKSLSGGDASIAAAQDAEVSVAVMRYVAGERSNWGLA